MEITAWTVLFAAAVTAVMTGVGALPFAFMRQPGPRLVGYSHALAAGLMLAASHSLIAEGALQSAIGVVVGMGLGVFAIVLSNRLLAYRPHTTIASLEGADARRALLILGLMTAHSFAEGISIGVSFGGTDALGIFIATAIAFHNVPEGLAISLVLVPRGTTVKKAALLSIFTSLPQPLMAVPAFLFVQIFAPLLPIGLGFAAGAMIWMVFAELVPEATRTLPGRALGAAVTLPFILMLAFQFLILS